MPVICETTPSFALRVSEDTLDSWVTTLLPTGHIVINKQTNSAQTIDYLHYENRNEIATFTRLVIVNIGNGDFRVVAASSQLIFQTRKFRSIEIKCYFDKNCKCATEDSKHEIYLKMKRAALASIVHIYGDASDANILGKFVKWFG